MRAKMYAQMRYCIVEKSPLMREQERKQVPGQVEWFDSISEIGEVTGCVLSNELLDNFAVHRMVMQQELMEVYVDYQDGFAEVLQPARPELRDYLAELGIWLASGYATEVNLEALGFKITYRQDRPYKYAVIEREGCHLHFYHNKSVDISTPDNGCLIIVNDIQNVYREFSSGLKSKLGRVRSSGLPRISRMKPIY